MPKCYMCPSPTIDQIRAEGEKNYSFRKWLSDTDKRECYDVEILENASSDKAFPSSLNILQGFAPKLEAIAKIMNEETSLFFKVMTGLKEFCTELKDALSCHYSEAIIKWPNYVRKDVKDSTEDGIERKSRFAVMMSRKQMMMAMKSLNIQMDFLKSQYTDLITSRKKLLAALEERRSLLKEFPESPDAKRILSEPEQFCINPGSASPQSNAWTAVRSDPTVYSRIKEKREPPLPSSRRDRSCAEECKLRVSVHHCKEAIREVKETIKMALYRRRKASEVVHQTFYTYADRKKYEASPIEHGKYYGVGCNGTGGLRKRVLDKF